MNLDCVIFLLICVYVFRHSVQVCVHRCLGEFSYVYAVPVLFSRIFSSFCLQYRCFLFKVSNLCTLQLIFFPHFWSASQGDHELCYDEVHICSLCLSSFLPVPYFFTSKIIAGIDTTTCCLVLLLHWTKHTDVFINTFTSFKKYFVSSMLKIAEFITLTNN